MSVIPLGRRLAAEALGTGLLLAMVVGSGIMAERLAGGSLGLALLANAVATAAGLTVLILLFAPVSGAHFNPVISAVLAATGRLSWRGAAAYGVAQVAGALAGVALAHAMFELPSLRLSPTLRDGTGLVLGEAVATFGLVGTVMGTARGGPPSVAPAVGLYIAAAYWFTSSTSFANPAVTLARAATDSFAGIAPASVPGFLLGQALGALLALPTFAWILRPEPPA